MYRIVPVRTVPVKYCTLVLSVYCCSTILYSLYNFNCHPYKIYSTLQEFVLYLRSYSENCTREAIKGVTIEIVKAVCSVAHGQGLTPARWVKQYPQH